LSKNIINPDLNKLLFVEFGKDSEADSDSYSDSESDYFSFGLEFEL